MDLISKKEKERKEKEVNFYISTNSYAVQIHFHD